MNKKYVTNYILKNESTLQKFSGQCNVNYLVQLDKKYVLRVPIKKEKSIALNLKFLSESYIWKLLKKHKEDTTVQICKLNIWGKKAYFNSYIEGKIFDFTEEELLSNNCFLLDKLIAKIKHIQNILTKREVNQVLKKLPYKEDAASFYECFYLFCLKNLKPFINISMTYINKLGLPINGEAIVKNRKDEIVKHKFVLSHSDLHRNNIIYDGELHFIDWELTLYAPISYDIVMHFLRMYYSQDLKKIFMEKFFENESERQIIKNQMDIIMELELTRSIIYNIYALDCLKKEKGDLTFCIKTLLKRINQFCQLENISEIEEEKIKDILLN